MSDLIHAIMGFLERQPDLSHTRFGELVLRDPRFVPDLLKRRRRVWPETADRVVTWMREYEANPAFAEVAVAELREHRTRRQRAYRNTKRERSAA